MRSSIFNTLFELDEPEMVRIAHEEDLDEEYLVAIYVFLAARIRTGLRRPPDVDTTFDEMYAWAQAGDENGMNALLNVITSPIINETTRRYATVFWHGARAPSKTERAKTPISKTALYTAAAKAFNTRWTGEFKLKQGLLGVYPERGAPKTDPAYK